MDSNSTLSTDSESITIITRPPVRRRTCYDYFFFFFIGQIYTFAFCLRSAIAPITDVLEEEFHATTSQIGLCSSLLFIGYFSMQIPAGMALQAYCPEFISLCCSGMMGICAILFALAPNIEIASATQFFIGVGQSATGISVLTVTAKRLDSDMVPLGFGIVKLYCYFSLILMQYLQALIYETYSVWRPVFYFCGGTCIMIGILCLFTLVIESNSDHYSATNNDMDFNEISMQKFEDQTDGIRSQNTPLIESKDTNKCHCFPLRNPQKSNNKQSVLVSLKRALQNGINYIYSLFEFLMQYILYGFYGLWLISYLMLKYEYQRETATLISSSFYAAMAISGTVFGYLSRRFQRRKLFLVLGPILVAASLIVIYVSDSVPMIIVLGSCIIAGIGWGGQGPVFWASIRECNAFYDCEDVAVGVVNSLTNSAGFVSQYLIGVMLDWHWMSFRGGDDFNEDGDRQYSVADYDFAFITIAVCVAGAFLLSFMLKETRAQMVVYAK